MDKHWAQHFYGRTAAGERVMIVDVTREYRHGRVQQFPALLACRQDGLYRLWRTGREQLLAPGYVWPVDVKRGDAEKSLIPLVPKLWGMQYGSGCVLKEIPAWVFKAPADRLARVLFAWHAANRASDFARCVRDERPLRQGSEMPIAPLCRPVAITVIPNTDLVVRAINTGVLLDRLRLGLERIYIVSGHLSTPYRHREN